MLFGLIDAPDLTFPELSNWNMQFDLKIIAETGLSH